MNKTGMITSFGGNTPQIGKAVWIDPFARLIGNIRIADGASIWPGAVLRADESEIAIGARSAILDQCLLESPGGRPVIVAADVLISHKACLHGARVDTGALVGIGAIVLDGAVIGSHALVAAGAVVPPKAQIPPKMLVMGQPAKPVRLLKDSEIANVYTQLALLSEKAALYRSMGPG